MTQLWASDLIGVVGWCFFQWHDYDLICFLLFISLSAYETTDDYQPTKRLMIDRQLAFMPFRVQRNEPAAKRRRKGSPITLVPQNGSYQLTKQLMIDTLTFKNRRALRDSPACGGLRQSESSLTSRAVSVNF
jgi:hypothetical protein